MNKTFIMLKPDSVRRGLMGEIIARIERKGLKITKLKMLVLDADTAKEHYAEHANKAFFPSLIEFITSGPVVKMAVEGRNAIHIMRKLAGANTWDALPGSIRGDFAFSYDENVIHSSDSEESAERELRLHFGIE
jgi:nucleoside-diphosphate kinase